MDTTIKAVIYLIIAALIWFIHYRMISAATLDLIQRMDAHYLDEDTALPRRRIVIVLYICNLVFTAGFSVWLALLLAGVIQ